MSRLRIVIPILLSSLAIPAIGETVYPSYCATYDSPRCEAARMRAFEADRNAEINASMARVAAVRAELALGKTHCKTPGSTTPRCQAERKHELALGLTHCKTPDSTTPRCMAERARDFAAARNAEIDASIAAVARYRASVLALTHCKTPNSTTPRCMAERARDFAAARNGEINASMAAVANARALVLARTHCKSANSTTPRCEAERTRDFAAARNAEARASIAAVRAERARAFAAARNAEINISMARVAAERARAFRAARNAEINASMAAVAAERARAVAAARTAPINVARACQPYSWLTASCRTESAAEFAAARNAEINASMARVAAERARAFAAARNAEINASMAAAAAQRSLRLAMMRRGKMEASARRQARMETGAIGTTDTLEHASATPATRYARQEAEPCRAAGRPMSPVQFSRTSIKIDPSMQPALDRIARIARTCPAVLIEIHGHSDIAGPAHVKRHIAKLRAQAALNYLVDAGVDSKRLAAIGHGSMDPLVPNSSQANRAKNSRIEFSFKDPAMEAAARRVMWDLAELLDPTYVPPLARLSP
jgi:outer membrane protein OmpA-like peptidoglycan-associated protein